jgi:hypothetical protein
MKSSDTLKKQQGNKWTTTESGRVSADFDRFSCRLAGWAVTRSRPSKLGWDGACGRKGRRTMMKSGPDRGRSGGGGKGRRAGWAAGKRVGRVRGKSPSCLKV